MKLCKNCGHEIIKRHSVFNGTQIVEWKHKKGGTYCREKSKGNEPTLSSCLCDNAEPKEEMKK